MIVLWIMIINGKNGKVSKVSNLELLPATVTIAAVENLGIQQGRSMW